MTSTKDLLYYIPAGQYGKEGVLALLEQHPEIKFVSLVGIDLAGNDTDEKIPMAAFFDDYEAFFEGRAVQTDGSSVVLTNIATLNNARVDMWGDPSVNWCVDYNYENIDEATGLPTGTLRIPAFLMHNYRYVDSRSILKNSCDYVRAELLSLIKEHGLPGMPHVKADDVVDIIFTSATELEFWVKTPSRTVTKKELSVSQKLQEQYWQRTHGTVRTALEQAVERLDQYGMVAEMGHKEVGGVKAKLDEDDREFTFLTNAKHLSALDVANLYKKRWLVELFFKWLKQHLKIKRFWGTTKNAVRIQISVAIITYCLVAIVHHDMQLKRSTYEVLQILSISLTDKTHLRDLFDKTIFNDVKELDYPLFKGLFD